MRKAFRILLSITLVLTLLGTGKVKASASNEEDVLAYINGVRVNAGLDILTMDSDLSEVAAVRAKECAEKFSHTRPNGQAWNTISSISKGENLAHAVNSNQQKPENVVLAWTLSSKHNENLIRKSFTSAGVAYYQSESGDTYIVCEFK
nr:CAP domain-containing protein [uncultured Butyrivibrio sp.]